MKTNPNGFRLRGLSHRYEENQGETPVLDKIDLHVGPKEFVSIVGPSGCGKSTLLKIACGLLRPSEGELELPHHANEPLGNVGYMPQNDLLMPWRSVLENTIVGLEIAGMPRPEAREKARNQLSAFGLNGFETVYPSQLSGGMRQRAALLRTFLVERELYVLDEPFGSLDALTRLSMNHWLTDVWQASRASILFTTHDLDEALFLSDRIYVMSPRPGRILSEIEVNHPRPRNHAAMARDPRIAEEKARLLELLTPAETESTAP